MHVAADLAAGSCGGLNITPEGIAAAFVVAGGVVAGLTALALQVLRNARDIGAAWKQLRVHEKVLNGAVAAHEKDAGA